MQPPRELTPAMPPISRDDTLHIDSYTHPRELPDDGLALMGRAEQRHIEFGADWFALLVDTVYAREPKAHQVRLHVLRCGSRVLAVLPTVAHAGALGREVGALSNFYTALFAPALDDGITAEDLLPLLRAVRRTSGGAAVYRFAPMDPASREFSVLGRALELAGLKVHRYFAFGNWYEPVRQDWAAYLKDRSSQVRNTIKRNAKKFAAEGGSLEIVQGGERLEAGLAAYQAVYAQSWKVPEPYPDFLPELMRLCARRGWLRLGVAWVGDKPVAAQLWIVANGRADIYKLAYDEAYKALAPGTLLTARLMEQALDADHVREIDYLIGDDPYKAAWMSQRRERFGLIAYDPLTPRGLWGLLHQTLGNAWRHLRAKPAPAPRPENPAD
ncbi:GNAT family N-acetyltransferase [Roseateles sp.]|uniref:GNAT family N-acetyltransferase n=1 Tax=Roseateles sp. TaxID=1971397 RepID=UPI003264A121